MKTFKDSTGRSWEITLTVGSVKRVRALLDVDLLAIEEGDPPLLTRLATDVILLCDVIFVLVKPQADKLDVDDVEFGESLGGEVIADAQDAFYEELVLFSQSRHRMDLVKAIKSQRELIEVGRTRVESAIEKVGEKAKRGLIADIDAAIEGILGESSTNSQAQSASIPTR